KQCSYSSAFPRNTIQPLVIVSAALQEQLGQLALQDFPCGLGSWNKSRFATRRSRRGGQPRLWADPAGQEEDMPPSEESPEALIELLKDQHSPWALPPGCSPQDQHLREMAVLEPKLIRGSNVFRVLKSLRIVDKGVSEVDEGLLQLEQLEELILSANHISRITSANLPRTLKVLELCCNAVADLQDLCAQPPPELQHLGLGYNRLCGPSQDKFLTAAFWPNLVSLDLSFNNLTDLLGLVSQLSSLEKLRILVLKGNPLALIPTYRGFLVDSLPKLSVLDDIHIGFDERHQFLGLARQPDLSLSEARVVVSVGDMKGVPDPSTLQQLADDSGFPVITYSYCVTYEFVEGEELDNGSSTEVCPQRSPRPALVRRNSRSPAPLLRAGLWLFLAYGGIRLSLVVLAAAGLLLGLLDNELAQLSQRFFVSCTAKVFVTPGKPWEDTIDYSYRKEHIVKDLMRLKSYLAAGTIVSVVEEKVSWWARGWIGVCCLIKGPQPSTEAYPCTGALQGPARKDKQKKKKEKSCELRSDPPIRRTLGTRKVTLEALLATEDLVTTLCDFGILITEQPPQPPSVEEKVRSVSRGT
uniref:Leucine rich repeat containing 43 n=1 Tax=Strigops habroptila TaxID=2489341 RepID=A0A672U9V7_STRHB